MMAGAAAAYTAVDKKSILIFAASAMLAAIFAKITSRGPRLLLAAAAGAVLVFVTLWSYGNLGLGAYQGREVTVRGIVVSAAPRDDGSLVLSCVVSPFEKVRVRYTGDLSLQRLAGSTIEFSGTPATPERAGNPGCYERRRYLYGQGFSREFYVSDICYREKRGILGRYINTAVRCREGFLDRCFTESEAAAFARGVLFGRADMMDEETLNAFRRNGTAHILAVSGLHIGIIFACWDFVRKKLKLTTAVPFVVFLLFYGTAVMWPSSVIRATATIALKIAGEGLNRRFDMASAMALITILMMIKNPMVVLDTGTIMSFLAVSGITFLTPHFRKIMSQYASSVMGIHAALVPFTAYTFNYIPLLSPLVNIPVLFLTSLYVPCAVICFFAALLSDAASVAGGTVLSSVSSLITWVNSTLSFGDVFSPDIVSAPAWIIAVFYVSVFLCGSEWFAVHVLLRKEKSAMYAAVLLTVGVAVISAFSFHSPFDGADIVFVDVGQGDCVHLRAEGHTDILVDGGGSIRYNVGEKVLKPYLLKNGAWDVDLAFVTHMHTDHYKGIEELCGKFRVRQTSTELLAGDTVKISEDVYVEILWPTEDGSSSDDENFFSRIYKVHVNGVSVLITGDITEEGEDALIRMYRGTGKLKADILKVAHHGSRYSSSQAFIDEVEPLIAVIQVGRNNYGHPSQSVIEKLESSGIIVYRTDLDGAVGIKAEEEKIRVCTQKSMLSEDFRTT